MTATEADLQAYVSTSGRDWDGLCQALIWNWCAQFGNAPVTYASALDAYYASPIHGSAFDCPPGGFAYLDIGSYGHVTVLVNNKRHGMASSKVTELWGIAAGEVDLGTYIARTGAEPLGWSPVNGANDFDFVPDMSGPEPEPEGEDSMKYAHLVTGTDDGRNRRLFVAPGSSWYLEVVEAGSELGAALGKQLECGSSIPTSQSVIDAAKAAADRMRRSG